MPLGHLKYTAEEFIAIQLAIKIRGNITDAIFKEQISAIANGLENSQTQLPATRHKADAQLATMHQGGRYFIIFCEKCLDIWGRVSKIPTKKEMHKFDLVCRNIKCQNKNLPEAISEARGYFVILSIRKQIEGYLKDKKFATVLQAYQRRTETHMNGKLHKNIVQNGHFDLSLGIDAAQLHNTRQGKSILPAVLFMNNIPVCWQLRYPILAALWTGETSLKPPRSVFLQYMQNELRELGTDSPITWTDPQGNVNTSFVFLTTVIADAPEKALLLNQRHSGRLCCPYCKVVGETLTYENYPHVFRDNPFRRTVGTTKVQGTRFPVFVHHDRNFVWRNSKDRLKVGLKVAIERSEKGKPDYMEDGLKGLPVLRRLPGTFKETGSHVSDFLHLIGEGVLKDIMEVMMKKGALGHSFLQTRQSWDIYHEMQESMTSVSECDRNCQLLINQGTWKAYDYWEFLIHCTALLCSDENLITNTAVYDCLVHLSNVTYLWYLDRITPEVIDQVREEIKLFCYCFRSVFTEEFFTYKAHVLQHIPDMMEFHGSGAYTDAFNTERFISKCKKLCTTTRVHMTQISRNFLLTHQSQILQAMENFSEEAKKTLNANKFFNEEFFAKFSDVVKLVHPDQAIPEDVHSVLRDFVEGSMKMNFRDQRITRVIQMVRKSIILESEHASHRANTSIDDSFIQVHGNVFGRITDIFHFPVIDKFVFIMTKYERTEPRQENGCTILYPLNQFPFIKPANPEYFAFLLTENLWIQKAKVCETSYFWDERKVKLFTVRPHFLFRF